MSRFENYNKKYIDQCLLSIYEDRNEALRFIDNELVTQTFEDVYFLPFKYAYGNWEWFRGGLLDSNGKLLDAGKLLPNRLSKSYKANLEDAIIDDREVIYIGAFWPHWGHFILEQISRLYYFFNEIDNSLPIVYLGPVDLTGNFLEVFELLGIKKERLIRVKKLTRFKKVIIPEQSVIVADDTDKAMWGKKNNYCYYTKDYVKIFEKLKSNVQPLGEEYQKVFYSRQNFDKAKGRDLGEHNEVQSFFEKIGYKLVSPEKLSVREQIGIMKSCKDFVTFSGTLAHNLIFAEPNTKAVILNKSYVINPHQPLIDEVSGIMPTYIDVHLSFLPHHIGWGPFYIYVEDKLMEWAKENGYELNREENASYFKEFIDTYLENAPYTTKFFNINMKKRSFFDYYLNKIADKSIDVTIVRLLYCFPLMLKILYYYKKYRILFNMIKYKLYLL